MSALRPADELLHPALRPGDGPRLEEARLQDQEVLAVLLQGAALLAHLEHAGWGLEGGWHGLRLVDGCLPRGLRAAPEPGADARELLIELLRRGFRVEEGVAGRGVARRAARRLLEGWRQPLAPLAADRAVAQILEEAPFLWRPAFAAARAALAARARRGDETWLWVAGPGPSRDRLLDGRRDLAELVDRLASPAARRLWLGVTGDESPLELARAGRWRRAAAVWTERPPRQAAGRRALAECLFALGRFESALETLRGDASSPAELLRLWSQLFLGELGAARKSLRRLARRRLDARQTVECAEAAGRILANSGDLAGAWRWIERARTASRRHSDLRLQVDVVAALAAWDGGELDAMKTHLDGAAAARDHPDLAWKWWHARALWQLASEQPLAAGESLGRALAASRRRLRRVEAAALWNDLVLARAHAGDLAGAERACRHAVHLLAACQGPRQTTLALSNLAEIRVRRGRLAGVPELLEECERRNRTADNVRAWTQDHELWARYELARGRPDRALERCREALERLDAEGLDWRRDELRVLAARALGWLGRPAEAAERLLGIRPEAVAILEPEERPALWTLAGDPAKARRAAPPGELGRLWKELLGDSGVASGRWACLAELEPFRGARLVADAALVRPGAAPPAEVDRAAAVLRQAGAEGLAARLAGERDGPWEALTRFLGEASGGVESLAALFLAAGFGEVSLRWLCRDAEWPIVSGRGGPARETIQVGDGSLVLEAERIGPPLRALFAIAASCFEPPLDAPRRRGAVTSGIVGESPALRRALERVARFAGGDFPVLILGESGTGKELVAREIHRLSPRARAPFLPINCAALPDSLVLSDLFGHARGAFTGADRDRAGVFETARGGTVFLDEVGDLPLAAQGLLLRVLQEGEVRRVGESHPRRVDVRVVAATHRELESMVAEGDFREDLYFRLKVASVSLPPLRERGRDVVQLARRFLAEGRDDGRPPRLSPAVEKRLLAHPWPGNVRELRNVLAVARALAGDEPLRPAHLDLPAEGPAPPGSYHAAVEQFRRRLVREALELSGGNRAAAARRLGLSRQALSYLVRQLGLA